MFNRKKIKLLEDRIQNLASIIDNHERSLDAKIKGLALIMGFEPISLFKRRYDAGNWEPFEWQDIKRKSKKRR